MLKNFFRPLWVRTWDHGFAFIEAHQPSVLNRIHNAAIFQAFKLKLKY